MKSGFKKWLRLFRFIGVMLVIILVLGGALSFYANFEALVNGKTFNTYAQYFLRK